MHEPSVSLVLSNLRHSDVVLDIGGAACPFNRANYVMDAEAYESRGFYRDFGGSESQGGDRECFTKDAWIQRDICDRTPFPFKDNELDFVICSHTLEDIRDPLWVCSEINRIGKAGYIETPSRLAESSRGWESHDTAGLSHHRWIVEITDNHIQFLMKYHMIHRWRYSFPVSHLRKLPPDKQVTWLFWRGSFSFSEKIILTLADQVKEMEEYVERTRPYSPLALKAENGIQYVRSIGHRARAKIHRTFGV